MLIVFFPVGLFLIWRYKTFNKGARIVLSVFAGSLIIGYTAFATNNPKTDTTAKQDKIVSEAVDVETSDEEETTEADTVDTEKEEEQAEEVDTAEADKEDKEQAIQAVATKTDTTEEEQPATIETDTTKQEQTKKEETEQTTNNDQEEAEQTDTVQTTEEDAEQTEQTDVEQTTTDEADAAQQKIEEDTFDLALHEGFTDLTIAIAYMAELEQFYAEDPLVGQTEDFAYDAIDLTDFMSEILSSANGLDAPDTRAQAKTDYINLVTLVQDSIAVGLNGMKTGNDSEVARAEEMIDGFDALAAALVANYN